MVKATEQKGKLNRAVIVSIILHIILISLLIWGSMQQESPMSEGGSGSAIDAVMVDPNAVQQQYQRQQQQQDDAQRAENQRNALAQKREQELQQQRAEEQQKLKSLEKERLQVQQEVKKAAEEAKQIAEAAKKQAAEEAEQAREKARQAAQEAKKQASLAIEQAQKEVALAQAAKKQAEAERKEAAKKAAEEKKKRETLAKQQASEVNDLFGGLASQKNAPSLEKGNQSSAVGQGNSRKSGGASQAEIDNYGSQITTAIQSKFYDYQNYIGKVCTLRIQLAPDGLLIDVKAENGDPALCQAAVAAARQARIPRPPSEAVYQAFKNAPVDFKPE